MRQENDIGNERHRDQDRFCGRLGIGKQESTAAWTCNAQCA